MQAFPTAEEYYPNQGDESFDSYGEGSRMGMDDGDDGTELDMITDDGDVDEEVCPPTVYIFLCFLLHHEILSFSCHEETDYAQSLIAENGSQYSRSHLYSTDHTFPTIT